MPYTTDSDLERLTEAQRECFLKCSQMALDHGWDAQLVESADFTEEDGSIQTRPCFGVRLILGEGTVAEIRGTSARKEIAKLNDDSYKQIEHEIEMMLFQSAKQVHKALVYACKKAGMTREMIAAECPY